MDTNEQLRVLGGSAGCISFKERFERSSKTRLAATKINILQINVGKRCNLSCRHCHVDENERQLWTLASGRWTSDPGFAEGFAEASFGLWTHKISIASP